MIENFLNTFELSKYNDKVPFSNIIYVFKDSTDILIEEVVERKLYRIREDEISNYISVKTNHIDWMQLPDKSFVKMNNSTINHLVPLFDEEYRFVNLRMVFRFDSIQYRRRLEEIKERVKKFKSVKIRCNKREVSVTGRFPLFRPYLTLNKMHNSTSLSYSTLMLEYNGKIYNYPYGNVSNDGRACFNDSSQLSIDDTIYAKDHYYNLLVSKTANTDYAYHFPKFVSTNFDHLILDLDIIESRIQKRDYIHILDALCYLSSIKDVDKIHPNILVEFKEPPKVLQDFSVSLYKLKMKKINKKRIRIIVEQYFVDRSNDALVDYLTNKVTQFVTTSTTDDEILELIKTYIH